MIIPQFVASAVSEALRLLPSKMTSDRAIVQLYATGLQESRFESRRQLIKKDGRLQPIGPATGYWQFELGSAKSRAGVWGVFLHSSSRAHLERLCAERRVAFDPPSIHEAIQHDDVLAAGLARLMYWTVPFSLPGIGDQQGAWKMYVDTWRPGKPHPETWAECYATAMAAL